MTSHDDKWGHVIPTNYETTPPSRWGADGPIPSSLPCRLSSGFGSFVQVLGPSTRDTCES